MKNNLLILLEQTKVLEKERLLQSGDIHQVSFGKREIVHLVGEACTYFEIIASGQVVVERIDEAGNLLTISTLTKGDILGANLVFSSAPFFPMTVTATEETHIYRLSKAAVKTLCTNDEAILDAVLTTLSNRSLYLGDFIKRLSKRSIRDQLNDYIHQQYKLQNQNPIKLPASKTYLAGQFGIARTSLSRELQKMKEDGLIDFTATTITLLEKNFDNFT